MLENGHKTMICHYKDLHEKGGKSNNQTKDDKTLKKCIYTQETTLSINK